MNKGAKKIIKKYFFQKKYQINNCYFFVICYHENFQIKKFIISIYLNLLIMKIKSKLKKNIDAFTLIEVMVVLAIIGILASLIIPNLTGRADQARIIAAKQDIMSIDQALSLYKLDNASIPTNSQNLNSLVIKPEIEPIT